MAAAVVTDNTLANVLAIMQEQAVYSHMNLVHPEWTYLEKRRIGASDGSERRFNMKTALGSNAVKFMSPAQGTQYASGHQVARTLGQLIYKEFAATVLMDRAILARAASELGRYGDDPMVQEMEDKAMELSRRLSIAWHADGTGVLAQAADAGSVVSSKTVFNVSTDNSSRGCIGFCHVGDHVLPKNADGTAAAPTLSSGTFSYYVIDDIDDAANTLTMRAVLTTGADGAVTATGITAGDFLYFRNETTISDLSSTPAVDYNTLSLWFPGMESLTHDDGREVHNLVMSGVLGGSRYDAGTAFIDAPHFQRALSKAKKRVGNVHSYNQAIMAYATQDTLIDAREASRYFVNVEDGKRGVRGIGYVHGRDVVMFEVSPFCRKDRVWMVPEGDVVNYYGSKLKWLEHNPGQIFHAGTHADGGAMTTDVYAYLQGSGAMFVTKPAAVAIIDHFTISA